MKKGIVKRYGAEFGRNRIRVEKPDIKKLSHNGSAPRSSGSIDVNFVDIGWSRVEPLLSL